MGSDPAADRARLQADMPPEVAEIWFDFDWSNRRLGGSDGQSISVSVAGLSWLLGLPIWRDLDTGVFWRVRPLDVLRQPHRHTIHHQRIEAADLAVPVVAMENRGRLMLLDGYHRLTKAYRDGAAALPAKLLTGDQRHEIQDGPPG